MPPVRIQGPKPHETANALALHMEVIQLNAELDMYAGMGWLLALLYVLLPDVAQASAATR